MDSRVSVTMPIEEYQREVIGVPFGAVFILCVVTFIGGLVVGMSTLDERVPEPRPSVQPFVPPQRTAAPSTP